MKTLAGIFGILLFVLTSVSPASARENICLKTREIIGKMGAYFREERRSYFELNETEKANYLALAENYLKVLTQCRKEVRELIPYREIAPAFFQAFRDPLGALPEKGFSFVFLSIVIPPPLPVIREVFEGGPELFVLIPNPRTVEVIQKEKGLERKNFCYIEMLGVLTPGYEPIVKCFHYRLEKNLSDEFPAMVKVDVREMDGQRQYRRVIVLREELFRNETLRAEAEQELQKFLTQPNNWIYSLILFHETTRVLINWLDREFGEKGRGLIRRK